MSERKVVGKKVVIILGIICIILAVGLIGAIINYTSILKEKDGVIASLNSQVMSKDAQIVDLQSQIDDLNATYNWLKQHSFTYYVTQDYVNISNVCIYKELSLWYYVNGTVTNTGNKPIKTVYIYAILVNPDGSKDFSPYRYATVSDIWMGETATFAIDISEYKEDQTVEFFVIICY